MKGAHAARILFGVASLSLVGVLVLRDAAAPGPGPLHPAHADHPDLAGLKGCVACHGEGRGPESMSQACLECHSAIAEQIDGHTGMHGALSDTVSRGCASCHGEHHGKVSPLVGDTPFLRAGFAGTEGYTHEGLDFRPLGMHLELACDSCHPKAYVTDLMAGEKRFIGLEASCVSCHEDPHGGRMQQDCGACHSQSGPFSDPPLYEHSSTFPLEGPHALEVEDGSRGCVACHVPSSPWSVEALIAAPPTRARGCVDCHDSSHSDGFLAAIDRDCVICHGTMSGGFAVVNMEASASLHGASGAALDGAHREVACAECHDPSLAFEDRYPGRDMQDCSRCHVNVHVAHSPAIKAGSPGVNVLGLDMGHCASCHTTSSFQTILPNRFDHELSTGFKLSGAHARVECTRCHGAPEGAPRRLGSVAVAFPGPRDQCSTCHDDPHGGFFEGHDAGGESSKGVACDSCHTTESFLSVRGFNHDMFTGFELSGAHARAECTQCHVKPPGHPWRLGSRAAAFPGPPGECSTCHDDPHGGFFGDVDSAGPGAESLTCATCHNTDSFHTVPGFDHGTSTGFALSGAHAQTQCTMCHVAPDGHSRRLGSVATAFPGQRERCSTCHVDPHGGYFDSSRSAAAGTGPISCDSCHVAASFHLVEGFDHGAATGFHLEGAHGDVKCSGCHEPQAPDALGRTAAHAAGTTCVECHADPHLGQFEDGPSKNDCSHCHDSLTSFAGIHFDHSATRFPLDAKHARLECASCHKEATTVTGETAVRYRPLGRECVDCHDPAARGGGYR